MRQFQLAVATRCFNESLVTSIETAAAMNIQGLQFELRQEVRSSDLSESGRRDLLHRISEHGLKIASTYFPLNHPLTEPSKLDVRVEAIREAMKFSYAINSRTLCFRVGRISEDENSKSRKLLIEILSDLARYAGHIGTSLAIAPTNDSAETLRSILGEIKTGPIGIDFDPANFAMNGRSVLDSLKQLHNLVMHVQLRDGTRGIEGGEEAAVGQGNVDWIELLALLGEMDFHGWMTGIRNDGDERTYEISRGIRYIQKLMLGG